MNTSSRNSRGYNGLQPKGDRKNWVHIMEVKSVPFNSDIAVGRIVNPNNANSYNRAGLKKLVP